METERKKIKKKVVKDLEVTKIICIFVTSNKKRQFFENIENFMNE